MKFDLDYEYAEKVYRALDEATPTQVALGFKRALARKLGNPFGPAPEFDPAAGSVPADKRFERFFDELFTVAPKDIDEALSTEELRARFQEAHDTLLAESARAAKSKKWQDVAESYRLDADAYEDVLNAIDLGDVEHAIALWNNMDTAARDWMFTGDDEVRNRRTALALGYA